MQYRYPLLVLLSILTLTAGIYGSYRAFRPSGLPFTVHVVNGQTAVIEPIAGIPLPSALHAGDRIDLPVLDTSNRIAIAITCNTFGQILPLGHTYELAFWQAGVTTTIPVTTVNTSLGTGSWISSLSLAALIWLMSVVALMLLWRGRGRAAVGMILWAIAWMTGIALEIAPLDGGKGLVILLIAYICILVSRIGFYLMFEAMLEGVFKPRVLLWWRLAFAVQWMAALFWVLATNLLFPLGGSAEFLIPNWGSLLGVSYLVPLIMLYSGYHAVSARAQQRLRWMLWGGTIWAISAFGSDVITFASFSWNLVWTVGFMLAACCFVYAVLRHRVVNVSVFIDRTLVYGGLTAIVVGILAAVNSIAQHAALGSNASLLLQIIVPLALGIVLGQVRNNAEKIVERVFFRKKYLAGKALRRFARHCGHFEQSSELLQSTVEEIRRHLNVPGVAIYVRRDGQYSLSQRGGELAYPERVKPDDAVFVVARGGQKDIDLSELQGVLGADGYAFPMTATGSLQGLLVCTDRPGEHFASDERKLLAYVVRQVSISLYALRMQESMRQIEAKARLVDALASGALPASVELQSKARELIAAS